MLCNNNILRKDRVKRMASQQTPNYRLSRWAGTDRILVEEFNDNWDKIDAALGTAARQAAFHTILDVTTTEDLKDAAWPLNIDWTEWEKRDH